MSPHRARTTRAQRLAGMLVEVEDQKKLEATKVRLGPAPEMLRRRLGDFGPDRPREPMTDEDGAPWSPERQREVNRRSAGQAPLR